MCEMDVKITFSSDGLINGELLLDLPSDKDLLDGLNLIPAFKKLILKKAEQVR